MKIVTWNVNGIRACNKSTSIKSLLDSLDADIICLQETKITSKEFCYKITENTFMVDCKLWT